MIRVFAGLLRSAPQRPVPLASLLAGVAILWLAPMMGGLILMVLVPLTKTLLPTDLQLMTVVAATALMFSPLYSWIGWLLALPPTWALLRLGWFGWLAAAGTGLITGAVAGSIADSAVATPFGLIALLLLRLLLVRTLKLPPN